MTKVALRGLAARKLRALTTTLAVLLGVGLVAGTYVLTDTINRAFDEIFADALASTDVIVAPREVVDLQDREPPAFRASYLERVRRVDGVEAAAGAIDSFARLVDARREPIGPRFAPNFVTSVRPARFETLRLVRGRYPRSASEASLDRQTAKRAKLSVGDRVGVAAEGRVRFYAIVGVTRLGDASFGGGGIAQLTLREAQRVTGKVGKLDHISVAAREGVSPEELRDRIGSALPRSLHVETGGNRAERQSEDIGEDLGFLTITLLVFAGVSLFVGAFLIFNTFSITVAQRVRELGMLRTLGASRGQAMRSVLLEATLIGAIGSVLGLAGGIAFARAINALLEAVGIDLPSTGTVLATRTILVALLVGLAVTLASALVPALRATRVPPMAALRDAELPPRRRRGRLQGVLAAALGAGGVALACAGLFGGVRDSGSAAGLIGGGAVAVLLGVSLVSPRLVRPLASAAGRPMEAVRGITGRLARENAVRKPGRTAATAAALMIGLAIVTFVTVFAAGIKGSISNAIDRNLQGDLVVQNIDGFSPIPSQLAEEVRGMKGVETVSTLRYSLAKVVGRGDESRVSAVDPRTAGEVLSLDWKEGSPATLARLGRGDALVDDAWATSNGIEVGDRIRVVTPANRRAAFVVRGRVKDNADLLGDFVLTHSAFVARFDARQDSLDLIGLAPGADARAVQRRIARLADRSFPTAEVMNQAELKDKQADQINRLLGLVYALLSLAVVVSLFGIVNTLALSIHERTRELGMLRAVGASRALVRRMIRYEAVITALIGALLGLVLGCAFAALVSRPLADEGFTLSYPVTTLIVLLVLGGLAGVVAAVWPARRASRIDLLQALAYE